MENENNNGDFPSMYCFGDLDHFSYPYTIDFLGIDAEKASKKEREIKKEEEEENCSSVLLDLSLSLSPMWISSPSPTPLNSGPNKRHQSTTIDLTVAVPTAMKRHRITARVPVNSAASRRRPQGPDPAPALPAEFRQKIHELGGSDPELVVQKLFKPTDVNPRIARLAIPVDNCTLELNPAEKARAIKKTETRVARAIMKAKEVVGQAEKTDSVGFEVDVIEPRNNLHIRKLIFKRYESNDSYIFLGHWNDMVTSNGLKAGDVLQIWSFRRGPDAQLCFAFVKLDWTPPKSQEDGQIQV